MDIDEQKVRELVQKVLADAVKNEIKNNLKVQIDRTEKYGFYGEDNSFVTVTLLYDDEIISSYQEYM